MNSNQQLLDSQLRHKLLLLGFSKQVANEVVLFLRKTEPAIRRLILQQFTFKVTGRRLLARLRQTEARLRLLRGEGWARAKQHVTDAMEEMLDREPAQFEREAGTEFARSEKSNLLILAGTMVAGQTLKELLEQLEESDVRRHIVNLRIGVLAGEDVTKLLRRLTGRNALSNARLLDNVQAITATASSVLSDAVRYEMVRANRSVFDFEIWVSILDRRTTDACRKLHKKRFPVGEGPYPGYHIHCRSERVPQYSGGGSAKAEDYATWIAAQPLDVREYAGNEFSFANLKPLRLDDVYNE